MQSQYKKDQTIVCKDKASFNTFRLAEAIPDKESQSNPDLAGVRTNSFYKYSSQENMISSKANGLLGSVMSAL